jgi:uncharacterized membrane-anchored protein
MDRQPVTERSKVPEITIGFWITKILATTLGETGGDAVSMSWLGETTPAAGANGVNGYLIGTAIFGVLLVVLVRLQTAARRYNPWLYWATIIASTTAGTTLADFITRSLGVGYTGGSLLLLSLVLISLLRWRRAMGTVDVNRIDNPSRDVLLSDDHDFANAWHSLGRLGCRWGARLFRRRDPVRRRTRNAGAALHQHQGFARRALLDSVHPNSAARRDYR